MEINKENNELTNLKKTITMNGEEKKNSNKFQFSSEPTLESLRHRTQQFAAERNWEQFHTPRNLLLGSCI